MQHKNSLISNYLKIDLLLNNNQQLDASGGASVAGSGDGIVPAGWSLR